MEDNRMPKILIKGVLKLVKPTKVFKNQFLLTENNEIIVVNNFQKSLVYGYNKDTEKETKILIHALKKPIIIFQNKDTTYSTCDVNLTQFNRQRILENINKIEIGFLNIIDLLDSSKRFKENGEININNINKGYRKFIRLVSEDNLKDNKYYEIQYLKIVPKAYKEPNSNEILDSNISIHKDKIIIKGGILEGEYSRIE